jgi:hypothetical protein
MIKLLYIAVAVCFACKLVLGRWPWEYLRLQPTRSQSLQQARKLLALPANASRSEILGAHRNLIKVVHPDKGGSNGQVHEANAARDLLLEELPDSN